MARSSINRQIAELPGVQQAVLDAAHEIRDTARSLAVGHGSLPRCITLERPNDVDVDVVMDHHNALSIEVGHWDKVFFSGFVPGLHIMRDAARMAG